MYKDKKNTWLIFAALCSGLAALVHLGCVVFGGDWYRFLGAGEDMARMSEQGHWLPAVLTSGIAIVLLIWSLYALSGAKVIFRLPLLRVGLCMITAIYLIRGLGFVVLMPAFPENSLMFWLVSSAICLSIGTLYAMGTYQAWPELGTKNEVA